MKITILTIILFFCLSSFVVAAERVVQFREGMQIEVSVTSEHATEVFFPDNISRVIPQVSPQVLTWKHVLNRLYLAARAYAPKGSVIVVTQDGFSYSLLIKTAEFGGDKSVRIVNPAAKKQKQGTAVGNPVLALMTAMMTNTSFSGVKVEASPSLPEAWRSSSIIMLLEKTYTSPEYIGFVFQAINKADYPVRVPIQQIESKKYRILAVSADAMGLEKCGTEGSATTMYIIREKKARE